jgi:hypothetical protein
VRAAANPHPNSAYQNKPLSFPMLTKTTKRHV